MAVKTKVSVPIKRAGEDREIEVEPAENGWVEVSVPSVGTHRICKFEVEVDEWQKALAVLTAASQQP
jgi:hypothetical protein